MTDPISDYLTRIRNAARANQKFVDVPASRVKAEISKILLDAGFLRAVKYMEDNKQGVLRLLRSGSIKPTDGLLVVLRAQPGLSGQKIVIEGRGSTRQLLRDGGALRVVTVLLGSGGPTTG